MDNKRKSLTDGTKKFITTIFLLVFILISLLTTELILKSLGLGNPVIYDSSPIYGYRPLPDREYVRFGGSTIKFNNLGLRTNSDWDDTKANKILLLGDSVTYGGSYIDNNELFSQLTVDLINQSNKSDYISGNAGVNGWGVENLYGLVVESNFQPANVYVTVLIEGDFERGLSRMLGQPYFNREPTYALQELWYYFLYIQNLKRYKHWEEFSDERTKHLVYEKAVKKLREMDDHLKEQGFLHLIFISPTIEQVTGEIGKHELVEDLLNKYDLSPIYIADKIENYNLTETELEELYRDPLHLEKKGHELWAQIIKSELNEHL